MEWLKKLAKWGVILGLIGGILGACGLAGIFYYYSRDLPEILEREDFDPPQVTRVYSAEGEVIGEFFTPGAKRTVVSMEKIPQHVRDAFMAAEDADFMKHQGIDYLGMIRAFYYAARYDVGLKGTSTITQQVVKNLILTPERTYERKIREIVLARELEKNLTKDDILYLYLNTIYLGHGVNGVEEASRHYFGKSVDQLTLAEASTLAGLTQSPEGHTPFRHPERALKRRKYVLEQLWKKGFVEEAAFRKAMEADLDLADHSKTEPYLGKAPYFVEHVRKFLTDKYGEDETLGGGLRVHTTLQIERQLAAQKALREGLHEYDKRKKYYRPKKKLAENKIDDFIKKAQKKNAKRGVKKHALYDAVVTSVDPEGETVHLAIGDRSATLELVPKARIVSGECEEKGLSEVLQRGHVLRVQVTEITDGTSPMTVQFAAGPQAALVAIDPETRHVVSMVGGYDFESNKYDHVTQMKRQTGSTFKPFVYAAALEEQLITPASIVLDSPAVFPMPGGKNWSPKNSDGTWRGPIRIREGLGASRNVVAVRVLKMLGLEKAAEFAKKVGIKEGTITDNFTMVMGSSELTPLEITNAYATFASGGYYARPLFVTRIETNRGEIETFENPREQVISSEVAFLISSLMTSVVHGYTDGDGTRRGGTASNVAKLGHEVAGKTGTTNEARDAWFIGFTPSVVTGVWAGFQDNQSLGAKEYGGRVAAPIWLKYMEAAMSGIERAEFQPPAAGITTAEIDPKTGKLAREGGIKEWFLVGTAPTEFAPSGETASGDDFMLGQFEDSPPPPDEDAPPSP